MSLSAADIDRAYGLRGDLATKRIVDQPGACQCSSRRDGSDRSCARMGLRETISGEPRAFAVDCMTGQVVDLFVQRRDDTRTDDPLGDALARQAAEQREDHKAGAPRGSKTMTRESIDAAAQGTNPLERARQAAAEVERRPSSAGAPEGAWTLRR